MQSSSSLSPLPVHIKPQRYDIYSDKKRTLHLINKRERSLRAANEARTRDPQLGKLVLYQLSYCRLSILSRWRCKGTTSFPTTQHLPNNFKTNPNSCHHNPPSSCRFSRAYIQTITGALPEHVTPLPSPCYVFSLIISYLQLVNCSYSPSIIHYNLYNPLAPPPSVEAV